MFEKKFEKNLKKVLTQKGQKGIYPINVIVFQFIYKTFIDLTSSKKWFVILTK